MGTGLRRLSPSFAAVRIDRILKAGWCIRGLSIPEDPVVRLWTRIRSRQLGGFQFVRQEPISRYYADFVCRDRHLIVELDGGQHAERPKDRQRDSELCALGYRVIRIWNNDVIDNLDGVLQMLQSEREKSPLTPALSPQAGRGS